MSGAPGSREAWPPPGSVDIVARQLVAAYAQVGSGWELVEVGLRSKPASPTADVLVTCAESVEADGSVALGLTQQHLLTERLHVFALMDVVDIALSALWLVPGWELAGPAIEPDPQGRTWFRAQPGSDARWGRWEVSRHQLGERLLRTLQGGGTPQPGGRHEPAARGSLLRLALRNNSRKGPP